MIKPGSVVTLRFFCSNLWNETRKEWLVVWRGDFHAVVVEDGSIPFSCERGVRMLYQTEDGDPCYLVTTVNQLVLVD